MDTIGSYRAEREAILNGHPYSGKSVGPNWENVNKRILPQLIYKGHLLEREALCQSGLFFACPYLPLPRKNHGLCRSEGVMKMT